MNSEQIKVLEILQEAQKTYEERASIYGDSCTKVGSVLEALYPNGIGLKTQYDFNRFVIISTIVSKLCRYVNSPYSGHQDSIHDIGVYSFILEAIDNYKREEK